MKTKVIGIGHKARHGKDTLATYLLRQCPEAKIYTFGADLKAWCRVQGFMTNKKGSVLQLVGTDLFRNHFDSEVWVRCLQYQIEDDQPTVAIIPDMRMPNEKEWVEARGGITVKISRLNNDRSPYVTTDRDPNHYSETALDGAEFTLSYRIETGDLALFEATARQVLASL